MFEEEIILEEKQIDLLKLLFQEGIIDEFEEKGFKINYYGEKNDKYLESLIKYFPIDDTNIDEIQSNLTSQNDERNYIIYIKYKNIYIGGISIFDFKTREGFGLNKYINNKEKSFYIGQWEDNQKCGIGFFKIDNNHLYFGNFKENRINDDGIYFNKESGNFYYGIFNDGEFKEGFYINLNKNIYYIGKFFNNKKNDYFSLYINYEKKIIFIGQIKNDIFIKGYIAILKLKETTNDIILKIKNVIYKDNEEYSEVDIKHDNNLETLIYKIPQIINNLQVILNNVYISLLDKEKIYDDNTYNLRLGRYNSTENAFSFEKELIDNYDKYANMIKDIEINVKKMKSKISI